MTWYISVSEKGNGESCSSGSECLVADAVCNGGTCGCPLTKYLEGTTCLTSMYNEMGLVMRKPAFCICENKDADQLRGNRKADQPLCFCYIDSTVPLFSKYEISSL